MNEEPACFGEFFDSILCVKCAFYDECEAEYLGECADEIEGDIEAAYLNDWGAIDTLLDEEEDL